MTEDIASNYESLQDHGLRLKRLEERVAMLECAHEWHADQDNDCNFCVKCGARQEIYTE